MHDDSRVPGSDPDDYATNKASASDYILREARDAGVRLVRCLWADLSNVIRGRSIHVGSLRQHMIDGIGIPAGSMGLTINDVQAIPGLQGHVRLLPDPSTFHVIQYAPNTALMLGELYEIDLQPWALCPRTFLKRMLADLTDMGLHLQVGFELEFYFAVRGSDGGFVPVDESLYSSSVGMGISGKVINDIVTSIDEQRLQLDHYHPEMGHGQQELVFRPADPLTACDRVLLARETVRSIAWSHGWYASFAAKPFDSQPPSGMHAHISLLDRYDRNLMCKPEIVTSEDGKGYEMQDQGRWFVSGILSHLPALTALACPTVNSYRRLHAQTAAQPYVTWGYDNRQAMLRLVPLTWKEGSASASVEFKLADGSANPYLMMGGLIAAGLDGIASKYSLPEPLAAISPLKEVTGESGAGPVRLPLTLQNACESLAQDGILASGLSAQLLGAYLDVKRQEIKSFEGVLPSTEMIRHFWKF
jgi:glutamine synthetase